MFMKIAIDYQFVDLGATYASLNDCFGLCLRNTSCYGIVYVLGVCFLKNPIYKTSNTYRACTQNISCEAYDFSNL